MEAEVRGAIKDRYVCCGCAKRTIPKFVDYCYPQSI